MSFPAYSQARDSGVEWLGEVPSHWQVRRLGGVFTERREKVSDTDFPALSVTKQGIVPQLETAAKTDDNDNRKGVRAGDFVINSRSDRKGSSGLSQLDGSVSLINTVITPDARLDPTFVHFLLRSVAFQEEFYRYGKGIVADLWSTNYSEMKNILLAFPERPEQAAIAAFLDRETAKIDALIEEQRRLITLLKEKRQAVISYAVIKGLDPHAPMKDSGIEWLGKVPAHWQIVKVARYFRARKGKEGQLLTKEYCASNAGDHPVYSGQTENGGIMGTLDRYEFDTGSNGVLFSTTVGAKAMTVSHLKGRFSLSQNCMIIEPEAGVTDTRFYFYHFQPLFQYHRNMIPEHMQASFRMEDLYSFAIALPPPDEQSKIASYLDKRLTSFDDIEVTAAMSISLLQERRAALISAAVTGKIDLRGAPTEQEREAA